jgi:hypothetical protein
MTTGTGSGIQDRNPGMVDILAADFQARDEPNFAWKSVCSMFLALPGLRGFWPMSSFDDGGDAYDLSGQGRTLTYNGDPDYGYWDLRPYIDLDGTGDYLDRADEAGLDITGAETFVTGARQGLTMGGWFQFDELTVANNKGLMSKWVSGTNDRSYLLYHEAAGDTILFGVSGNGIAGVFSPASIIPAAATTWYFCVGRYDTTSADVDCFINNTWYSNAGAGPASIFSGIAESLSDAIVGQVWEWSRALFGQ